MKIVSSPPLPSCLMHLRQTLFPNSNAIHTMSTPMPTMLIHGTNHVHTVLSFPIQITASQDCIYKHFIDLLRHGCKFNQCFCITLLLLLIHTCLLCTLPQDICTHITCFGHTSDHISIVSSDFCSKILHCLTHPGYSSEGQHTYVAFRPNMFFAILGMQTFTITGKRNLFSTWEYALESG